MAGMEVQEIMNKDTYYYAGTYSAYVSSRRKDWYVQPYGVSINRRSRRAVVPVGWVYSQIQPPGPKWEIERK